MGGSGSGRRLSKKQVVEDCLPLIASTWMREGIFKEKIHLSGRWLWKFRGGHSCAINYEANTLDPANSYLRVIYDLPSKKESFDYRIKLTTTRPHFGGLRWWFICPLTTNGKP